jgi:hypothetical protein
LIDQTTLSTIGGRIATLRGNVYRYDPRRVLQVDLEGRHDMKTAAKLAGALVAVALLLSLCGFGSTAASLSAQEGGGPSILELLPVTDPPLQIGSEIEASLTETDYVATTGGVLRAFTLEGRAGEPVTLDLISDDFDAMLYLIGPGYEETLSDDDSGGECHSRLSVFLPEDGQYRIVASSLGGGIGAFTLRVDTREHPVAEGDCNGGDFGDFGDFEGEFFDEEMLDAFLTLEPLGALELGSEESGTLSDTDAVLPDDSRAKAWTLSGEIGESVFVELISEDFDALLVLVPAAGDDYEIDDDSAGSCNSQLQVTFEGSEPYLIVVNSLGADGRGAFTLRVSERPGAPEPGYCGDGGMDVR